MCWSIRATHPKAVISEESAPRERITIYPGVSLYVRLNYSGTVTVVATQLWIGSPLIETVSQKSCVSVFCWVVLPIPSSLPHTPLVQSQLFSFFLSLSNEGSSRLVASCSSSSPTPSPHRLERIHQENQSGQWKKSPNERETTKPQAQYNNKINKVSFFSFFH